MIACQLITANPSHHADGWWAGHSSTSFGEASTVFEPQPHKTAKEFSWHPVYKKLFMNKISEHMGLRMHSSCQINAYAYSVYMPVHSLCTCLCIGLCAKVVHTVGLCSMHSVDRPVHTAYTYDVLIHSPQLQISKWEQLLFKVFRKILNLIEHTCILFLPSSSLFYQL